MWVLSALESTKLELGDITSIIPIQPLGLFINVLLVSTQSFEKIPKPALLHNNEPIVETT